MVGHASVIVETSVGGIWCDPWLTSKAFNNSWTLWPAPKFFPGLYESIQYLWISHEHPDHFNIPTLKSLDTEFKSRVQVLFQDRDSEKVFAALRNFGFQHLLVLPDRQGFNLGEGVTLTSLQAGVNDSALAIRNGSELIINLNDAPFGPRDELAIRRLVGEPDVLLNQFSIAGNDGFSDGGRTLSKRAAAIPPAMCDTHERMGAKRTLPFASFVYFNAIDNKAMNQSANSISKVVEAFAKRDLDLVVLRPGDTYEVGASHDNTVAIDELTRAYDQIAESQFDVPEFISEQNLRAAFGKTIVDLSRKFPPLVRKPVGTLKFYVVDHQRCFTLDFVNGEFRPCSVEREHADISIYSQPLHFALSNGFGFETLAVSGRFEVLHNRRRWKALKRLTIAGYQGLHFRSLEPFKPQTLRYFGAKVFNLITGRRASEPVWRRA